MKRVIIFVFFIPLCAQTQLTEFEKRAVDSLQVVIERTTNDSIKVQALAQWDALIYRSDLNQDFVLNQKIESICISALGQNLPVVQRIYFQQELAKAFNNIGLYRFYTDNDASAIDYFQKCLRIRQELNDAIGIASVVLNVGNVYWKEAQYDSASFYFLQCLSIEQESGNKKGQANALNNLGVIATIQGNSAQALDMLIQSLTLRLELNDWRAASGSYDNIARIYYEQGNTNKAGEFLEKGLDLLRINGDFMTESRLLHNYAFIYKKRGDLYKALNCFDRCLKIGIETGDKQAQAHAMTNMASVLFQIGNTDSTIEILKTTLDLHRELGDRFSECSVLSMIGSAFLKSKNYVEAITYSRQSLEIALQIGAAREINKAGQELFQAHMAIDSDSMAGVYINIFMNQCYKALAANFPILSEAEKELYFNEVSDDYNFYYDFTFHLSGMNGEHTARAYENAMSVKSLLLKSSTAMRRSVLASKDSALIERYEEWIELKQQIAEGYSTGVETKSLEEQANEIEKELVIKSQSVAEITNLQKISWKDIQSELSEDESAIEFVRFTHIDDYGADTIEEELYCAILIRKDSQFPDFIRLFSEPELQKIIGTFPGNNLSYIDQVYGSKENTKSQLYDLIWKPMEKSLDGVKKVYVSPVGLLHKISFSALAKEQGVFLCDVYEIETQSSTGNIAMNKEAVGFSGSEQTTIFGGIDYNSDSTSSQIWHYLDGSLTETQKIEKILNKNNQIVNYYSLSNATEEQFKQTATESNILHIATHGFFYADPDEVLAQSADEEESSEDLTFRGGTNGFGVTSFVKSRNPLMRSGLVFAGANDVWTRSTSANDFENTDSSYKEDGVLTAAEVATLDLRKTELVVLSACETGLGDIKGSEGVYGLQRAFKMAGVKYIIMSLWQVPDKETAEFMMTFYKTLTKMEDIRKAFNATQRTMRKKYDPYYWSAFVLIE